eukprot:1814278-Prorocentrum_lima.AAC.1
MAQLPDASAKNWLARCQPGQFSRGILHKLACHMSKWPNCRRRPPKSGLYDAKMVKLPEASRRNGFQEVKMPI